MISETEDRRQKTDDRGQMTELFEFGMVLAPRREAGIKVC